MDAGLLTFVAVDWNGTVVPWFGKPPYAGALSTLNDLRNAGTSVIIVSCATQAEIEAEVRRLELTADEVFGCEDKGPIFSELRMRYGSGWVIGDHPADLRAAQSAGLPFLQACLEQDERFEGRDGAFEDWSEVGDLLVPETGTNV